ncbi:hypothetical protein BDN72DRAFT_888162 [Pluteus cervinus]|uniref:Uncharacterized protein n=1 Tax=Pluteus cervinus TaxID=181527 RepID=A0ACD3AY82_9AGAR|nr:hypothetical protein BDN72DRAFT_888162 [Pluteus cervinus]
MPTHRDRSRSRSGSPQRQRYRSHSRTPPVTLPHGAEPISEADYFRKSDEFRVWLREERRKYLDELSSDKARSHFRKFVKAWNRGKLSNSLYAGVDRSSTSASSQTAYKWGFASKNKTKADEVALQTVKEEINSATWGSSSSRRRARNDDALDDGHSSRASRIQGPTLPTTADLTYARELAEGHGAEDRAYKRKRDKMEARDRVEDMVGPKEVGKEAMLEKKRARRENDKAFRDDKDGGGLEVDESTLLGGGDSFKDRIAKRDAARQRGESARQEKANAIRERASVMREKEKATMDMFQQLAKQRFG